MWRAGQLSRFGNTSVTFDGLCFFLVAAFWVSLLVAAHLASPHNDGYLTNQRKEPAVSSHETQRFVANWNRIHKETSRVLRAAPDDKLDWRPRDGMFSLRELIVHIPQAEIVLARSALDGSTQNVPFDFSNRTGAEISAMFDSQHDELAKEVSQLTVEQLNAEVEFHGKHMRRIVLLWFMTEHEIHHRGQVFTYYRLAGVEPPNLHE